MRRLTAAVLVVLLGLGVGAFPASAPGQSLPCGLLRAPVAYEFESITVGVAAVGFTAAKLSSGAKNAVAVRITQETDTIRMRFDGTDPTATVGHKRSASDAAFWVCHNFTATKFIRDTGASGDATLRVTYFTHPGG